MAAISQDDGTSNGTGTGASTSFTSVETNFAISVIKNLTGDIPVNWDAVATEMNYKDASVARVRWTQIRKKKLNNASTSAGIRKKKAVPSARKTPAKKVKGKIKQEEHVRDDVAMTPVPSKGNANGNIKKAKFAEAIGGGTSETMAERSALNTEQWIAAQAKTEANN